MALVATPELAAAPVDAAHQDWSGVLPSSLMTRYSDIPSVSSSFLGGISPGPPSLASASHGGVLTPVGSLPEGILPGPPPLAGASYVGSHPSHWPDPKGFEVVALLFGLIPLVMGGVSSTHSYGYGRG